MELNNIIFTSDNNVQIAKISGINVLQNLNNNPNGIILIQSAIDDDQSTNSDLNEGIQIIESVDIVDSEQVTETFLRKQQLFNELSLVCRCCLNQSTNMQNIFDNDHCLPEMIMSIAPVQVLANDGYPSQICEFCASQISRTISFRQQIEAADSTLKEYVSHGFVSGMKLMPVYSETVERFNRSTSVDIEDAKQFDEELMESKDDQLSRNTTHSEKPSEVTGQNEVDEYFASDAEADDKYFPSDAEADDKDSVTCDDVDTKTTENITTDDAKNSEYMLDISVDIVTSELIQTNKNKDTNPSNREITSFKCNLCNKYFTDMRRLNRHKKIHLEQKPYNCKACDKGFNERSDLTRHMSRHLRSNSDETGKECPFKCTECSAGFNFKPDLEVHSSIHTKTGVFSCNKCEKVFSTIIQLKRHVRIHFKDKPHKCPVCNKGFAEMGSRTRHFRRHTGEQREKKFLCTTCGKKYFDSHSLAIHIRSHTGEKPWKCNICSKTFSDSRLLNSHSKVHSEDKPYSCTLCDRSFTHQSTLTTHLRTHTGEKPYVCSVCGKTFIQSSNLSLHMRSHSGEKPYKCKTCGRKFSSSSSLTIHNRIHTGEKPYKCPMCDKRFARHDLSAHVRTHTGEKPYKCTIKTCTKRFTTSGQLTQHLRAHNGLKPYVCHICNQACSTSSYLKKHINLHKTRGMPLPLHAINATSSELSSSVTGIGQTNTGNNIEIIETDDLRKLDIIPKDDEYILLTIPRDNDEAAHQANVLFQF